MDSVAALRHEFPALGLTLGFAPKAERQAIADIMLLWLEFNRARSASENLIAAARITWWRDALTKKSSEGVPLAERLIGQTIIPVEVLASLAKDMAEMTLNQSSDDAVMRRFAQPVADAFGGDADELGDILLALKMAMVGQAAVLPLPLSDLPLPFRLMAWLCRDTWRLKYPDEKPWLALAMIWAKFRNQI
jgi:hypothetical protein